MDILIAAIGIALIYAVAFLFHKMNVARKSWEDNRSLFH